VQREHGLKKFAVIGDTKVQEFVDDHEILKGPRLDQEVSREANATAQRARRPFAGHALHRDLLRLYV